MSQYKIRISEVTASRCTSKTTDTYALGDVQSVEVRATRSRRGEGGSYRRTVTYQVRDGVASVRTVEPSNPRSNSSDGAFRVSKAAAILNETDKAVLHSVPEVESVQRLGDTLEVARDETSDDRAQPDGWGEYDDLEAAAVDDDGLSPRVSKAGDGD